MTYEQELLHNENYWLFESRYKSEKEMKSEGDSSKRSRYYALSQIAKGDMIDVMSIHRCKVHKNA
jgi:hypothetical protein